METTSLLTDAGEPVKRCFKCERQLPREQFYRPPMMADGLLGKCKRCTRQDVRDNRKAKRDYYVEYDRMRSKDKGRQASIKASTNKDPLKVWARKATQSAEAWGVLVRQPCEVCGSEKVDAHHQDYRNPLAVRWLCRAHHMELHRFNEDAA